MSDPTPPKTGLDRYEYRGFTILLFASGDASVLHEATAKRRSYHQECDSFSAARSYIDCWLGDGQECGIFPTPCDAGDGQ